MLIFLELVLAAVMAVSMWIVFDKAGAPGWAALVPIYNIVIFVRIAGFSGWSALLLLVPLANIVYLILVTIRFAEAFGRGGAFAVGMIFLPFIFYPILAFDSAAYYTGSWY